MHYHFGYPFNPQRGTQKVEDTNFQDPSKWTTTPANSWTVSNSKATCNAKGAIYCDGYTKNGVSYDIEIHIDAGAVFNGRGLILRASYQQEVEFHTAGVHRMTMVATSPNTYIIMESEDDAGTLSFTGSVSFLSVIGE
jgi:hypothetical protein